MIPKLFAFVLVLSSSIAFRQVDAGIIKDLYQKITNTNNQTEVLVKQSAPICGSGIFSTTNESQVSPEIFFITDRASRGHQVSSQNFNSNRDNNQDNGRVRNRIDEVANEFRFHVENVTLEDLERNGFNPEAPVAFLMHGFTSGYPLQAWISAIVESYTIDRETNSNGRREPGYNLFVINWHYAARGIAYPRAVANIPIVASYVTKFINEKIIGEAGVDPRRIQLIGHSLGAHLAGFIGKNTRSKVGRIYGLDPAGPCFGAISGPLYPSNKRLAPDDAEEVITIHTNTALLGIDKPLGKYSVFVEGGSVQPGCKGGGVLKSLHTLTFDGGDFDTIACSHSRAPNLLTYRHQQSSSRDDCQLVAYECKDWESFLAGHCGLCDSNSATSSFENSERSLFGGDRAKTSTSLPKGDCKRIGLEWQYPASSGNNRGKSTTRRPYNDYEESNTSRRPNYYSSTSNYGSENDNYGNSNNNNNNWNRSTSRPYYSTEGYGSEYGNSRSTSRRPYNNFESSSTSSYDNPYADNLPSGSRRPHNPSGSSNSHNQDSNYDRGTRRPNYSSTESSSYNYRDQSTRRPSQSNYDRNRRQVSDNRNSSLTEQSRRGDNDDVKPKTLFIKTGDTQPYCAYHYQVVLELYEPFEKKKPPMSIILQDSESSGRRNSQQNSLSNDDFGNKFNDKMYTHLLTSNKKLKRIDHATILFRDGLKNGDQLLKQLHINYMSHSDRQVREKLSSRLCLVKKQTNVGEKPATDGNDNRGANRFYFEPCREETSSSSYQLNNNQRDKYDRDNN